MPIAFDIKEERPYNKGMLLTVYIFCAIVGIPLTALFALGGGDADVDAGGFDVDVDAGADFDLDVADAGVGDFTGLIRRIPVSSYTMFLAFFGGVGAVSTWVGVGVIATLIAAIALGVFAAGFNAALFAVLRNSAADSSLTDRELEGRVATVSIPIEGDKRGRVWIDTGSERVQITAGSVGGAEDAFVRGDKVVIVEMNAGVAKVMAVDPELELE